MSFIALENRFPCLNIESADLRESETKRPMHTPVPLSPMVPRHWTFTLSCAFVKVAKIGLQTFGSFIQSSCITRETCTRYPDQKTDIEKKKELMLQTKWTSPQRSIQH
jgi:hypothetical protein